MTRKGKELIALEVAKQELLSDLQALAQKIDGANALEQTITKWSGIKELLDALRNKTNEDCTLCPVYSGLMNPTLPRTISCSGCPAKCSTNLQVAIAPREFETLCSLGVNIRGDIHSLYSCVSKAIEELRKSADNIERYGEEESNEEEITTPN